MTNSYQPEDIATADHERALKALERAILLSQGQFRLILVRCNYALLRERMKQRLQELFAQPIRQIVLPESVKTLYTTIKTELDSEQPSVLMLFGLESVTNLEQVIISTDQVREEFQENLPFPIVIWIDDRVLQKLIRLAPGFESWATTVEFKLATN